MSTPLNHVSTRSTSGIPSQNSYRSVSNNVFQRIGNFFGILGASRNPPSENPNDIVPLVPFRLLDLRPEEMVISIVNYLGQQDLRVLDCVHRVFRSNFLNIACTRQARHRDFIPAALPPGVNYTQLLLHRFPNAIGPDCIRENIGEVGEVPPIPLNFIIRARAQRGFKLVFFPKEITIKVDGNSPLMLSETGKLIENPENSQLEPTGDMRELIVPTTPNNLILIAQKILKKNLPSQFAGMSEYAWQNVLDQHGDTRVVLSRWTCQKEDVIGLGQNYSTQVTQAQAQGLEIVSFPDRLVFHLLLYINSGKFPQSTNWERTSTPTVDNNGRSWQSAIRWPASGLSEASGPLFRLYLNGLGYDVYDGVGVAVGVPSGSSQDIGT